MEKLCAQVHTGLQRQSQQLSPNILTPEPIFSTAILDHLLYRGFEVTSFLYALNGVLISESMVCAQRQKHMVIYGHPNLSIPGCTWYTKMYLDLL